mmetsp:Transcript_127975/g.356146  ORF Transcript_127975/g.356146 Transcript_127975/m.356146 type:complete len:121 (+) Transcript_127975:955-1317(+)
MHLPRGKKQQRLQRPDMWVPDPTEGCNAPGGGFGTFSGLHRCCGSAFCAPSSESESLSSLSSVPAKTGSVVDGIMGCSSSCLVVDCTAGWCCGCFKGGACVTHSGLVGARGEEQEERTEA